MAAIVPDSNSTFPVATLEKALVAFLRHGQIFQNIPVNNPNSLTFLTSSEDDSTGLFIAQVAFPCKFDIYATTGTPSLEVSDYLFDVPFANGGSGTLKATNWAAATVEATILQKNLEIIKSATQSGTTQSTSNITWSLSDSSNVPVTTGLSAIDKSFNATFTANYQLPLIITQAADGSVTSIAKEYLP